MPDLMGLDGLWLLDSLAIQVLHEAPNLATVALLAAALPQYLDARPQAIFRQAMRQQYGVLTQPGTSDGPPPPLAQAG